MKVNDTVTIVYENDNEVLEILSHRHVIVWIFIFLFLEFEILSKCYHVITFNHSPESGGRTKPPNLSDDSTWENFTQKDQVTREPISMDT